MKPVNPEEIKVGMKLTADSLLSSGEYFIVDHIGEKRLTGRIIYTGELDKEEWFFRNENWYLYEEPKKKKLVAPFSVQYSKDSPFPGIHWGHQFLSENDAKRSCEFSGYPLIKWYSELAVEVDDE